MRYKETLHHSVFGPGSPQLIIACDTVTVNPMAFSTSRQALPLNSSLGIAIPILGSSPRDPGGSGEAGRGIGGDDLKLGAQERSPFRAAAGRGCYCLDGIVGHYAYGNPAMISRYSAASSALKLRQIQGLVSKRSKAPLLSSTRESRDHAASVRYYSFFSL